MTARRPADAASVCVAAACVASALGAIGTWRTHRGVLNGAVVNEPGAALVGHEGYLRWPEGDEAQSRAAFVPMADEAAVVRQARLSITAFRDDGCVAAGARVVVRPLSSSDRSSTGILDVSVPRILETDPDGVAAAEVPSGQYEVTVVAHDGAWIDERVDVGRLGTETQLRVVVRRPEPRTVALSGTRAASVRVLRIVSEEPCAWWERPCDSGEALSVPAAGARWVFALDAAGAIVGAGRVDDGSSLVEVDCGSSASVAGCRDAGWHALIARAGETSEVVLADRGLRFAVADGDIEVVCCEPSDDSHRRDAVTMHGVVLDPAGAVEDWSHALVRVDAVKTLRDGENAVMTIAWGQCDEGGSYPVSPPVSGRWRVTLLGAGLEPIASPWFDGAADAREIVLASRGERVDTWYVDPTDASVALVSPELGSRVLVPSASGIVELPRAASAAVFAEVRGADSVEWPRQFEYVCVGNPERPWGIALSPPVARRATFLHARGRPEVTGIASGLRGAGSFALEKAAATLGEDRLETDRLVPGERVLWLLTADSGVRGAMSVEFRGAADAQVLRIAMPSCALGFEGAPDDCTIIVFSKETSGTYSALVRLDPQRGVRVLRVPPGAYFVYGYAGEVCHAWDRVDLPDAGASATIELTARLSSSVSVDIDLGDGLRALDPGLWVEIDGERASGIVFGAAERQRGVVLPADDHRLAGFYRGQKGIVVSLRLDRSRVRVACPLPR